LPQPGGASVERTVIPQPGIQSWLPVDDVEASIAPVPPEANPPAVTTSLARHAESLAEPSASYSTQTLDLFFAKARFIGIFAGTYILFEDRDDLVLMDQHAAHERVLFEQLLRRAASGQIQDQPLLVPASMEITSREAGIFESRREQIEASGFRFDFLGRTQWQSARFREMKRNSPRWMVCEHYWTFWLTTWTGRKKICKQKFLLPSPAKPPSKPATV
jgi:hypothetical protein